MTVADVEESEEAKEPPPMDVVDLCHETFQKTAEYLRGELEGTFHFSSPLLFPEHLRSSGWPADQNTSLACNCNMAVKTKGGKSQTFCSDRWFYRDMFAVKMSGDRELVDCLGRSCHCFSPYEQRVQSALDFSQSLLSGFAFISASGVPTLDSELVSVCDRSFAALQSVLKIRLHHAVARTHLN